SDFDFWSYAKCTRKKGCRIGPSCAVSEERCFSECFAGDADNPTSAQESSGVGRGNGIAYSNCCGPDHRAALHHGNYSPERIPRNPPGSSTAALGTAPGAKGGGGATRGISWYSLRRIDPVV